MDSTTSVGSVYALSVCLPCLLVSLLGLTVLLSMPCLSICLLLIACVSTIMDSTSSVGSSLSVLVLFVFLSLCEDSLSYCLCPVCLSASYLPLAFQPLWVLPLLWGLGYMFCLSFICLLVSQLWIKILLWRTVYALSNCLRIIYRLPFNHHEFCLFCGVMAPCSYCLS